MYVCMYICMYVCRIQRLENRITTLRSTADTALRDTDLTCTVLAIMNSHLAELMVARAVAAASLGCFRQCVESLYGGVGDLVHGAVFQPRRTKRLLPMGKQVRAVASECQVSMKKSIICVRNLFAAEADAAVLKEVSHGVYWQPTKKHNTHPESTENTDSRSEVGSQECRLPGCCTVDQKPEESTSQFLDSSTWWHGGYPVQTALSGC